MLFLPLQEATGQALNCLRENGRLHKVGRAAKEDLWPRHSRAVLSECFSWKALLVRMQPALTPYGSRAAVLLCFSVRGEASVYTG